MAEKGDNVDLKDICQELDTLSLRILRLMEDLIQCKLNIEKAMKNGSLDLAKARYIMGNTNVSAIKLPTEESSEICALATVTRTNDESSNLNNITFHLNRISPQEKQKSLNSNVKQRTNKDYEDVKESDEESEPLLKEEPSLPEPKSLFQDPIKWFGVLVPQNLRQGQSWFQKALEFVVQSANIQSELNASIIRFGNLLKTKSDYIESVREP